jgi:hypothetical protein
VIVSVPSPHSKVVNPVLLLRKIRVSPSIMCNRLKIKLSDKPFCNTNVIQMMIRSRTVVSAPKPSFQRRSIGFTKVHGKTTKRVQASSRIPVASRATALKPTKNGAPKEVSRRTVVQATTKEPVGRKLHLFDVVINSALRWNYLSQSS